ncbi:MAG: aminotransferase class IV, partial [Chitinophagaceae bacterium]
MPRSICLNGKFLPADMPVLMADNKSYRYGDGLFETMRVRNGQIPVEELHFNRLFEGLVLLGFQMPAHLDITVLKDQIVRLCHKNQCAKLARVRLSFFRGNGGINDADGNAQYLVECWPLEPSVNSLNENGLVIDIHPEARKSCDKFSNLKSASHLPYIMAASYARSRKLNDCLLLNVYERIADSTIANVFITRGEQIITPPLREGCVNGVMRKYLLSQFTIEERTLTLDDLLAADEVFLTNAIKGIRWVGQFRERKYSHTKASAMQAMLHSTL